MNSSNVAKISFIGDISFNNNYIDLYKSGANPFIELGGDLNSSDLVIGNLECLAKGENGENKLKVPRLGTNVETLNYLTNINIGMVTLAHNHIYDHLESGYNNTIKSLLKNNISFIGAGKTKQEASKPIIKEINNIKFCFYNYVTEDTNPNIPKNAPVSPNFFSLKTAIKEIKEIRTCVDHIIILLHWGGVTEKGYYPDLHQPQIARRLIDSGADLIIGHHSHTVQPFEKYKEKYIFYSLGNFCFDDIIHNGSIYFKLNNRQKKSLIITIEFFKKNYNVTLTPIHNNKLSIEKKERLIISYKLRNLLFHIFKKHSFIWKLYFFQMKKINIVIHYFFIKDGSLSEKLSAISLNRISKFLFKRIRLGRFD